MNVTTLTCHIVLSSINTETADLDTLSRIMMDRMDEVLVLAAREHQVRTYITQYKLTCS